MRRKFGDFEEEEEDSFFIDMSDTPDKRRGGPKNRAGRKEMSSAGTSDGKEKGEVANGKDSFAREDGSDSRRRRKKDKTKREKGQATNGEGVDNEDPFFLDVSDSRFSALIDGDPRFGIDKSSKFFKDTAGMKAILSETSKRKEKGKRQQRRQ